MNLEKFMRHFYAEIYINSVLHKLEKLGQKLLACVSKVL